jgi:hypothetical protein
MSIISSPLKSVLSPAVVSVFGDSLTEQVLALSPSVLFDTSNLSSLYQDSAGTTPVTQAGDPVGLVFDKSGNDDHLTQATASQRPIYQADGTILTDGVDDKLEAAVNGFTDECTIAFDFVYQGGTGSFDWPIALSNGSSADEFGAFIRPDRANITFKTSSGGANYSTVPNTGTINVGDRFTFVAALNSSNILVDTYKNGSLVGTISPSTAVGVPTITQLQLATSANSNKVGGNFGRFAIFNTVLTETERALVAQWMLEN